MTPPPPPGARGRAANSLRLMEADPNAPHPLTTLATSLLPARDAAGGRADVWEELDRAAAWVCDHRAAELGDGHPTPVDRNDLRQALRVVCVAARSIDRTRDQGDPAAADAVRPGDLPWVMSVSSLVAMLRQRLVAQSVAAHAADAPSADPAAVLRVLSALDRLDELARADAARSIVDQLTGTGSLDLLVEVAHDMRSPLGSILFLVERLRSPQGGRGTPLTEAQDRTLALVHGAAFGLSAMVSDVMELARGGDRLAGGEAAPFSVASVLDAVCAVVRPLAEERRLTLVCGEAPPGARVGHAQALQRVLLNLVTNSLKYTPEGTVAMRVETHGRSRVAFIVEDTGRGIPASVLANLFRAFRPRATRDLAFSSAGLGLAICHKLIATMGGELAVDSEAGRGTRFSFELDLPPLPAAY